MSARRECVWGAAWQRRHVRRPGPFLRSMAALSALAGAVAVCALAEARAREVRTTCMVHQPQRGIWSALFALTSALLSSAHAEPSPKSQPAATATCTQPTALGRIACELSHEVPPLRDATVVVRSTAGLPAQGDARGLSERLSQLVAAELASVDGGAAAERSEGVLRAKGSHLVWLEPVLVAGRLDVTLDVMAVANSFWERVKQIDPKTTHHDFVSERIDPEIRSFLPTAKLSARHVQDARAPSARAQALECGDLDGDGSLELVYSDRHRVLVGRIRNGSLDSWGRADWKQLSPVSPAPLRQPIVTLDVQPGQHLDLGSTDRLLWRRIDRALEASEKLPGRQPWPRLGCVERQGLGLAPEVVSCDDESRSILKLPLSEELDTVAGFLLVRADGSRSAIAAARPLGADTLRIFDDQDRAAVVTAAGAQAALGDLDLDGRVEIIVSRDTMDPSQDTLRVFTWDPPKLERRFELPIPGGIDAIAACPVEDLNQAPLVVASGGRLLVIR